MASEVSNKGRDARFKFGIGSGVIPVNLVLAGLLIVIAFFPSSPARLILGVPTILFSPGYVLTLALFPRKGQMGGFERIAASFGTSIAIVPLTGLVLYFMGIPLRLEPIIYTFAALIFATSLVAEFRRSQHKSDMLRVEFQAEPPGLSGDFRNKALSVVLVLAILGVSALAGYLVTKPRVGEKFTEFYILGQGGSAMDYPVQLATGKSGTVIIGIINHEYERVSYRIEVLIDKVEADDMEGIALDPEQKWEKEVSFTPKVAGADQKVEFLLFRNDESEIPYRSLQLWIDVAK